MSIGTVHPAQGAFSPADRDTWRSATWPLGAHMDGEGATFAVYSKNATCVLLEIYEQPMGRSARFDYFLARGPDDVWRVRLSGVPAGTFYGFRCWGPNFRFSEGWQRGGSSAGFIADVDAAGHRFNPNKLLFDPYARELSHDRETVLMKEEFGHHAGMYGSGPGVYAGNQRRHPPVVQRTFDSGPWAPKSVLIDDHDSFGEKPRIKQKDAIVYEAHLRGLTRHPSSGRLTSILAGIEGFEGVGDVPEALRGTYAGAGLMAKYLKALGYTTIELLPVHEFANALCPEDGPEGDPGDRSPLEAPRGNYWGYMTYGYFAPDRRYAHDQSPGGPTREFKRMVKAFHDEGMEVYLDVVYNHTGEGGTWDAAGDSAELLFLRGLDNAEYYALTDDKRYYWDSTGCGNNLDASKDAVVRMIRDSLAYWSHEMGVDGFRFDLASVIGRTGPGFGFEATGRLLTEIARAAEAEQIEVIAEAWDTQGYHVGGFPRGWAEWNGVYRDSVRRFLRGDACVRSFIEVVNGDYARFFSHGGPHKSLNFLVAHDGFTLLDLVSYNEKNNSQPWPFGPSDGGSDDNLSWDSDGDHALRRTRLRSLLTVLMFSRGVPMLLGGDEFCRTQNGNNNPYKIDSIGTWHNYDMIGTSAPTAVSVGKVGAVYHDNYGRDANRSGKNGLFLFTKFLLALRRAHGCLRQDRFGDFRLDAGDNVTYWFAAEDGVSGVVPDARALHWRIDGSAIGDHDFLLLVNMWQSKIEFSIPEPASGKRWLRRADSASWAESHANFWPSAEASTMGSRYVVHPYSIAVLEEAP